MQTPIENIIENLISKHGLGKKPFLVGYSTGKDSTALLHALSNLSPAAPKIIAIHLNHGWREESAEEEAFARCFCEGLGVEIYCETLPPDTVKSETKAREARYDFFERAIKKFDADGLFLAHNKNDNVETLVYRVIKGTGVEGLKSIPEVRGKIYRPFLNVTRDEIEEYIERNSLEFREDASNLDTNYNRNRIRHEVLPIFEKINPNYLNNITNLIEVANFECEILDGVLKAAQDEVFEGDNPVALDAAQKMDTQKFLAQSYPIKLKLIYNYLKNDLKFYDLVRIKRIVDFIIEHATEAQDPQYRTHKRFSINSELFLYVNKKEILKK